MDPVQKWGKRALVCATVLGVCVFIVIAVYILGVLSTPVSIIIWTTIFVFLLKGIVNKLDEKGINRVIGTAIAYLVMIAVVAVILLFMFSPIFGFNEQVANMIQDIPVYFEGVKNWVLDMYNQYGHFLKNPDIQNGIKDAIGGLGNIGGAIASAGASGILSAGGAIGNAFMAFGFSLVIAFWVLIELPALGKEAKRFISNKLKEDSEVWKISFTKIMAGYIKGTFLQCFIIGVAAGLLFWALRIENSGALGCITGVLNIIPIFGPWIGGAVAGVSGVFVNPWIGLGAFVGTICIQQFVYTFISPKIMSDACNIHPALSLLALLAGGAVGGAMSGVVGSLVGMLLSIPFVAVFKTLFIYYYEKRTGVRIVSTEGVFFKGYPKSTTKAHPLEDALSEKPKKAKNTNKKSTKKLESADKDNKNKDSKSKSSVSKSGSNKK